MVLIKAGGLHSEGSYLVIPGEEADMILYLNQIKQNNLYQKITIMINISKISITRIIILLFLFNSVVATGQNSNNFEISKNLDIYATLYRELNTNYVDEISPGDLMKTGIDAMLESLDPYTVYIPESKIEDYKFMTTGQYGGIGAIIQKQGKNIIVAEPYENSPADKAGLQAGDIILKVDGKDINGKTTQELSDFLKGEAGSELEMETQRFKEEQSQAIHIKREKIQIKSVPYHGIINDSIGYFLLTNFTRSAYSEVKKSVKGWF